MSYFCHQCQSTFETPATSLPATPTCTHCGSDFIEETTSTHNGGATSSEDEYSDPIDPVMGLMQQLFVSSHPQLQQGRRGQVLAGRTAAGTAAMENRRMSGGGGESAAPSFTFGGELLPGFSVSGGAFIGGFPQRAEDSPFAQTTGVRRAREEAAGRVDSLSSNSGATRSSLGREETSEALMQEHIQRRRELAELLQ
ncbi:hypothetical protein HDU98_011633 [Podochytrium sp. JEL0797]|nr:hypothetical protein HDU98_011633 [Podochytrium sp. JEL0797]